VAEDRLTAKDSRVLLLWILAGVVGVILAWKYFFVAFPEAAVDFRISRSEAVERARDFLSKQDFPLATYEGSIVFGVDNNAKIYLEREVGLEQANRLMASEVNVWHWRVRFFRPKEQEEFKVRIDPDGRVVGMQHVVEEAREGASLEQEAAQQIAGAFLRDRLKTDLAAYDFLPAEANSTERPNRRDWSFTWERHGFKAKDAPYRLRVTVLGDAVGGYDEFLKVPEAWERSFARLRSSNELYQWLGQVPYGFLQIGAVLGVLYLLHLRGQVRWRGAMKLGLVLALLFFVMEANEWPLTRYGYDTNSDYSGFVVQRFLLAALLSVFLGMLVSLTVAAAEPLYRRDHPHKLRLGIALTRDGLQSKEFFNSCVIGLAMAAAHLGFVVMFYVVGKNFGFWAPQDINYTDAVSTALPWIYPLAISLYAATSEEFLFRLFAIPFFLRFTKSKAVAIVLPAFIWGFLHSAYPVEPGWVRGVEVGVIGVVAGWVMLRWGIFATLVWHYTVDAMLIGLFLLRSESLYFRLSGAFVGGAVLLPLAFAGVAYLSRRRFAAGEALLNQADPVVLAPVEEPAAPTAVPRVYQAVSPRTLGVALLVGALGAVLAVRVTPQTIGSFVKFNVTPGQATATADDILRGRNVDPGTFRRVAVFHSNFDPYVNEYLRRQAGIDGANRLYEEKVPAAFWLVRYFRDSEKEEYRVVLGVGGGIHSVHHIVDEKAPGATLTKEEAQACAEAFLRDEKHLDLAQWKLVDASSDKRPARTDHTFVWEEAEAVGEAHVRTEVKVLGDEVTSYRVFVKIPEEWERQQKETTLADIAYNAFRILLGLALGIALIVFFAKGIKQQHVPWKRVAVWATWAGLTMLVSVLNAWPVLLEKYQTEIPLRTFTIILGLAEFLIVSFAYAALFFLFGFAWFFLARAFGEERLTGWRGLPAAYYRDAFLLGLAGVGAFVGLSRLRVLVERVWPTNHDSFGAVLPQGLDTYFPAAEFSVGAITGGLFLTAFLVLAAGFLADAVKQRWMQAGILGVVALAMAGNADNPANFAKSLLFSLLTLAVIWLGVTRVFRFNLLGYFLVAAGLSLVNGAVVLLRQGAGEFHTQGYLVVAAGIALFLWPLVGWLRGGGAEEPPPTLETGGTGEPPLGAGM